MLLRLTYLAMTNLFALLRLLPTCWQREQLTILVVEMNPVLAPVLAVRDELEVLAEQRMEPVRHPDTSVSVIWIGCR